MQTNEVSFNNYTNDYIVAIDLKRRAEIIHIDVTQLKISVHGYLMIEDTDGDTRPVLVVAEDDHNDENT